MGWNDKPTDAQLGAVFNLTKWVLPRDIIKASTDWLKENKTRKEVSDELSRLRDLSIAKKLKDRDVVFQGAIWRGFNYESKEE